MAKDQDDVGRWEVSEHDKRGRQRGDVCFYCGQPTRHALDCVVPGTRVKVRLTLTFDKIVPHSWDQEQIEFFLNDGSWCASNILSDLEKLRDVKGCLCAAGVDIRCLRPECAAYEEAKADALVYGNGWLRVDAQGELHRHEPDGDKP